MTLSFTFEIFSRIGPMLKCIQMPQKNLLLNYILMIEPAKVRCRPLLRSGEIFKTHLRQDSPLTNLSDHYPVMVGDRA